jgi:hypothetical protein
MMSGAPTLGYGVSKAGVHYAAKKIHGEEPEIVVLVVHPGLVFRFQREDGVLTMIRWVQTKNGQNFADSIGVPAPPMTVEQSAGAVLAQVRRLLYTKKKLALIKANRLIKRPRPQPQGLS